MVGLGEGGGEEGVVDWGSGALPDVFAGSDILDAYTMQFEWFGFVACLRQGVDYDNVIAQGASLTSAKKMVCGDARGF